MMYGGVALLIVAGIEGASGLPFPLPDIYYANRSFWPFIGITVAVIGFMILKRETGLQWAAAERGQRFDAVVVYTREGCHLCDNAIDLLQRYCRYLPETIEIDIDEDPELQDRFNECVPVVEFDGKIRFRGNVNEQLLRRLIEGTKPLAGIARAVSGSPGGT
jgi:glutaredoxin